MTEGSFVPPEPVRQLRDLSRTRTAITRERALEIRRLEKLLEDAGITLFSVASDITGVSGRAMLGALIAGERDPAQLAELAKRRLRSKIPELIEALTGRFGDHHAFLAQSHLELIDQHTTAVVELTARIEVVIEPFRGARDLLVSNPGESPPASSTWSSPRQGRTWPGSRALGTSPRGPGPVRGQTSPPGRSSPRRLAPATPT